MGRGGGLGPEGRIRGWGNPARIGVKNSFLTLKKYIFVFFFFVFFGSPPILNLSPKKMGAVKRDMNRVCASENKLPPSPANTNTSKCSRYFLSFLFSRFLIIMSLSGF